jgi:hypothetical protein
MLLGNFNGTPISFDQMNRTRRKTCHATLAINVSDMWVPFFFLGYFSSSSTVLTQNLDEGSAANRDLICALAGAPMRAERAQESLADNRERRQR